MIRRAAESKIVNNTINIGSVNEEITISELAKLIIRIVGKNLFIEKMPDTNFYWVGDGQYRKKITDRLNKFENFFHKFFLFL